MQKKKKKNKLFIFLIICFVLLPFLLTKGCNYMESLNQAKNSINEPISSISGQIQPSRVYAQAHSIRKANWTGTAVPSSGYVENVYFNTNLSVEEVVVILDSLNIQQEADEFGDMLGNYFILVSSEDNSGAQIVKINDLYMIVCVSSEDDVTYVFSSEESSLGFIGWNIPDFVFNFESNATDNNGNWGQKNNLLTDLISITPFEQSSNNELSIGNLFAQLANAILLFGVAIVELFLALEPIFWNDGPTLIFILLIAAVAFALASWGLELLTSLIGVKIKRKKKKK